MSSTAVKTIKRESPRSALQMSNVQKYKGPNVQICECLMSIVKCLNVKISKCKISKCLMSKCLMSKCKSSVAVETIKRPRSVQMSKWNYSFAAFWEIFVQTLVHENADSLIPLRILSLLQKFPNFWKFSGLIGFSVLSRMINTHSTFTFN